MKNTLEGGLVVAISKAFRQPPRVAGCISYNIRAKDQVVNRFPCHELLYLMREVDRRNRQVSAVQVSGHRN
jgi:hypothetical protein